MREVASIYEGTSVLIEIIKNSFVYTEYHSALDELLRHPELKLLADEFRKDKLRVYHTEPSSFDVFDKLEEKREELAGYPLVDRFLKAEVALCQAVQEIQTRLTEAMCLELVE